MSKDLGKIKLEGYKCDRCGHIWLPRMYTDESELPVICPKCKSPYWNRPKLHAGSGVKGKR